MKPVNAKYQLVAYLFNENIIARPILFYSKYQTILIPKSSLSNYCCAYFVMNRFNMKPVTAKYQTNTNTAYFFNENIIARPILFLFKLSNNIDSEILADN